MAMMMVCFASGHRIACSVFITIALVCLGSGCRFIVSEPLPDFVSKNIDVRDLPETVKSAFFQAHPNAVVEKVESSSFKRKVLEYRITFTSREGGHNQVLFDMSGQPVAPPGTFRP